MALCIYAYHALPIFKHVNCNGWLAKVKKINFRSWEWLAFPGSWHPQGVLSYLEASPFLMARCCDVNLDNTLFIDCRRLEHLLISPRGTCVPHIGTHDAALERVMRDSTNLAVLRDTQRNVHHHVHLNGCPSGGAVVCYCKWGRHRSSSVMVGCVTCESQRWAPPSLPSRRASVVGISFPTLQASFNGGPILPYHPCEPQ